MGYIYSKAHEVIAVLSHAVLPSMSYMHKNKVLSEEHMFALERDEWVTRAWTYQEAVNARSLFITCEDTGDIIISGQDFMNYIGYTLAQLSILPLDRRARYPRLDALEDLIDYLTADYQERSALQVMGKMDRRSHGRPEDHFYAMIGAISSHLGSSTGAVSACEAFMRICERKGDFSFIYSSALRAPEAGRRWRPVPGDLPGLLQWDCFGDGEPGRMTDGGLCLEKVVKIGLGDVSTKADKFVRDWLTLIGQIPEGASGADVPAHVFDALGLMGFTGPGCSLATPVGFFFPVRLVSPNQTSFGTPSSPPPPPYGDTSGDSHTGRPAEKHKKSFAQRVLGLFRAASEPGPQTEVLRTKDLEILVHEASPNILEVVAHRHSGGRPAAVSTSAAWLVKRTAQAPYSRSGKGHSQSVALATEKATRKAAEEAHKRAIALATMAASAKTLEKAAAEGREE
ncbi:hypothetical protein VSDG_00130 [Cytospora chrysosperma]|uniref:Heterokaryon incompatibility domain-containing protein n=1 Tax=Cytospora chrysosperma TaxID=252740 RepID=A0A423WPN7_CYTCH|nr:hypothetical protein VSDG_00130 [Valsa sordida]